MDPKACLQHCQEAIDRKDYGLATLQLFDYYRWRIGGGFAPHNGDNTAQLLEDMALTGIENNHTIAEIAMSS